IRESIIPELSPGNHPSLKEILGIDADLSEDVTSIQFPLSNLVTFYNNPIKQTLRNSYGIDLFEADVPDDDVEPFDLNGLDKWKIRTVFHQQLIDGLKNEGASLNFDVNMMQSMSTRLELEGILPDAIAGQKSLDSVMKDLAQIWNGVHSDPVLDLSWPLVRKAISKDVNLSDGVDVNVSGEFDLCANDVYFALEAGSINQKRILQHWIHHVLLNCEGPVKSRVYFKEQKIVEFAELTFGEASIRLYNLLLIMVLSERYLIPIFPECSELYLKYVQNGDSNNTKNALRRIIDVTSGEPGQHASESLNEISSPWVAHAWAEKHPLHLSISAENMTPDQLQESTDFIIKMSDFDDFDAFSVISVKLFGLMKGDTL
ncbi:MAG TPA: hypothetical protein DCE78_06115, partial [Bacteroidetes bacterium]|nr:hypothetical protein [Bacteroidota bacterium]